jgi:hypothetical protein
MFLTLAPSEKNKNLASIFRTPGFKVVLHYLPPLKGFESYIKNIQINYPDF